MGRYVGGSNELEEDLEVRDSVVEELNKKHAVVRIGKFYVLTEETDILGNPTFSLEGRASFRAFYEDESVQLPSGKKECIADIWLSSQNRRKFHGITFDPGNSPDKTKYNLWKGFSCEPRKGITTKFWAHVEENICDNKEKSYEYVRKWLACIFQRPHEVHTSIVLCGSQGVGKNSFVEPLGVLFGAHYVALSGLNELLSSFNFHLKNAVLIHANEAVWGSSSQRLGTLKAMITDKLCLIEAKGKDRIMLRNYKHVIISSNENFPIHLDSDDRRFFVLRVSDAKKENHQYFKEIQEELDAGGYSALLYDLLREDISSFNPRVFPWSDESFQIKLISTNSCVRYIYEVLSSGYLDAAFKHCWVTLITRKELYAFYKEWCVDNCEVAMKVNIFGTYLKKIFPKARSTRLSVDGGRPYAHILPLLRYAKEDFCVAFKGEMGALFEK